MFKLVFLVLFFLSYPVSSSVIISQEDSFSSPLAEYEIKYSGFTIADTSGQSINLFIEITNTSASDGPLLFFSDFKFYSDGLSGFNQYDQGDGLIGFLLYNYEFTAENNIFPAEIKPDETVLISLGHIMSTNYVPTGTKLDLRGWAELSSPNSLGVIQLANIQITTVPIPPSGILFLISSFLLIAARKKNVLC